MQITVRTIASLICLLLGFISNVVYGNTVSNTNATTSNAASASPEKYDLEIDGMYYCITSADNLSVEVVGGENVYSGEIVIPNFINYRGRQFRVTSIADKCFYNSSITSIIIGKNISKIGINSFLNCNILQSVTISDGTDLLKIKIDLNYPWCFNSPIKYLYIGRDILTEDMWGQEHHVFYGLSNALDITIGPSVTRLGRGLLMGANKITTLVIPASVINIEYSAFDRCDGLKSVYFEDSDNNVNCKAYFNDLPIEYLYIGRNFDSDPFSYNNCSYFYDTSINKIDIGERVTHLTSLTDIENLYEINIPKNVEEIGSFKGCNKLRNIYCLTDSPPISDYDNVFDDVVFAMATLYVPKGRVETYQSAEIWKNFFEIKEIDENAASPTISVDENVGVVGIFDINGRRLSHTQNGLNIVKYSNGTVKKIIL